ncbi:unnamed protein product [Brassicogethes aeneus]|uniref:Uncharacterized protein n=1 Tax=Brassicogethes aeneus TaxID=1431903 RepID=A0A9P0BC86_BRAAE|nr:unnamed protein product [Brassicogethes aeneus]
MERKSTSYSNDIPSPVLLRRRLSAPETIMRKHVLAQQRSDDITQNDTRNSQWRMENAAESDPNLNKKRDSGLMRKSTLLRRLWSNSKPLSGARFSGSFYEWQHSFGKMSSSNSLTTSNHSSPEHKSQSRRSSPQHFQRKLSPSPSKMMSPKRKVSVYNGNYEYTSYSSNSATDNSNISSSLDNRTSRTITPKTESENYSTRSTTTSYTTFSENSDSAITNSHYSNNNSTTSSEITKQFIEESDNSNQEANQTTTTKETAKNINSSPKSESGTQTSDLTNLNVISNVQLSQSTLDLIFQQVIQDVNKTSPHVDTTPVSDVKKVIQVQEIPSFYLKRKEDITVDDQQHQRIVKYMISNIGTGSPYSKPAEVPQVVVPRFSAQPRSSSMEVNTSSGESDDKESDTVSLVDSLEDPHSPRVNNISPMLPDNSNKIRKLPKPSTFFIPMESNQVELKAVSDLLPDKVREKLNKRQQKLHEKSKLSSPRSDSNYISASDNQLHFVAHDSSDLNVKSTPVLPQVNYKKKRNKPLLPSIESIRKTKIDKREKDPKLKVKRKSIPKEDLQQSKSKNWMPKPRNKMNEKLTPIYTSKNEYVYNAEPRRIYHKTEFSNNNKRIEILEIMECVETPEKNHIFKGKSKIPVLVNQKLPKINDGSHKPSFLDFDQVEASDPKLDQLIANILIDTLNNSAESPKNKNERKSSGSPTKYNNAKYQQKFDVIPEELQSLEDNLLRTDIRNNNNTENNYEATNSETDNPTYKGKAAVAVVRDENFSTIPKGWITFYMLHKNQGTPDSTSDEGINLSTYQT